MFKYLLLSVS